MAAQRELGNDILPIRRRILTVPFRYLDEIKHPMDFGTMSQMVAEGKYSSMEDFGKDVELVFDNCRKFNPPKTYPVDCADAVEKVFKKEWAKATEKKLTWLEKRTLQGIMTALVKEDV
jgi:transcription initiation factor TFIID subunit 2